jgi:membrane fusion protein, epimerase transport system
MTSTTTTLCDVSLSVHERAATKIGWIGLAVVLVMSGLFLLWSMAAPLAATAVASGVVKSDRNRRVVQHQEGGRVSEIRVRDGDRVKADQVLLVLDDPSVRAELHKVEAMLDSELAKLARLEAERNLDSQVAWPAELVAKAKDTGVGVVLAREARVFKVRRETLDAQISLMQLSIQEVDHEIDALRGQATASADASARMQEELETNQILLKDGFVQKTRITGLQRNVSDYRVKQSEALAELAKAKQKRADLELRIKNLTAEFAQSASAELKTTADRIEQLRAQLEPNADAARRQEIKSPVAGRVVELKINTIGAVIAPRDTIMEIVPEHSPLVVEGRLRTDAIAEVTQGMAAGIRVLAFDQRTMPVINGKVSYVSADRQLDRVTGESYYTINVEVDDASLRIADIAELLPGMPTEIYLRAHDRSAMSYLVDPFTRRVAHALRDR